MRAAAASRSTRARRCSCRRAKRSRDSTERVRRLHVIRARPTCRATRSSRLTRLAVWTVFSCWGGCCSRRVDVVVLMRCVLWNCHASVTEKPLTVRAQRGERGCGELPGGHRDGVVDRAHDKRESCRSGFESVTTVMIGWRNPSADQAVSARSKPAVVREIPVVKINMCRLLSVQWRVQDTSAGSARGARIPGVSRKNVTMTRPAVRR